MRIGRSRTAQLGTIGKPSIFELAALAALCTVAGVGAGLAFESALLGLMIAAAGWIAVAAFGAATHLGQRRRAPLKDKHALSVTDIAVRRRGAQTRADSAQAPTPETETAADVFAAADPDRIVPFRMPSIR